MAVYNNKCNKGDIYNNYYRLYMRAISLELTVINELEK